MGGHINNRASSHYIVTSLADSYRTEGMHRSVLDYGSVEEIAKALEDVAITETSSPDGGDGTYAEDGSSHNDWFLPCTDPSATIQQSVQSEAERLAVLKSYRILGCEKEKTFDDITSQVRAHFNVPWAVISLIDMGRQFFFSISEDDLGTRQTSRSCAFCAHTILEKSGKLIIPDSHEDSRFKNNALVTGAPNIRFYAAECLTVPEGYRIGTLCIFDIVPRPDGLSLVKQQHLKSMATYIVNLLVDRRHGRLEGQRKRVASITSPSSSTNAETATPPVIAASCLVQNGIAKKSRFLGSSGGSEPVPVVVPNMVQQDREDAVNKTANGAEDVATVKADVSSQAINVIDFLVPSIRTNAPIPDPKIRGVDPDEYLLQIVKSMLGITLKVRPALNLNDFFPKNTEAQIAAYNVEVVSVTRENNVAALRNLCKENGRESLDCFNRFGEGLLNLACRRGFKEMVQMLLSDEVDLDVRIHDDYGRTPLHDACWNPEPQLDICTWIMRKDPSLFLVADKRGFTPFQYARKSHWHIWRQFLHDNRDHLRALANPEILSWFSA